MGKLEGRVAVITEATSSLALATAKLFVEEGAYVFITGRRQDQLDQAVKEIGGPRCILMSGFRSHFTGRKRPRSFSVNICEPILLSQAGRDQNSSCFLYHIRIGSKRHDGTPDKLR